MKGMKKISLLALGLAFVGVATGVKAFADTDYVEFDDLETEIGEISTLEQPESFPDIYINEDNKMQYHLENITVNTDNARTTFYLGEEFSADGLLVLADFVKLDENGNPAKDENGRTITVTARVTNYQVDSSNIDTSIMGRYKPQVSYRYGETVKTAEYTINVKSSEFETTKNLVYIAGVKAGFKDECATEIFKLKNHGRIATTYLQDSGENTFTLDTSDLNIQLVKHTVNRVATAFETEYIDIDMSTLTNDTTNKKMFNADNTLELDYSSVNTGKVGSYIVPIKYKSTDLVINDRTVKNKVESFIVVDVISPVVSMENFNDYEVEASMGLPDFTEYEVFIERKVLDGDTLTSTYETIYVTNDKFEYEGFVPYRKGTQTATFKLKELTEEGEQLSFEAPVVVKASTKYDISIVNDLSGGNIISEKQEASNKPKYYTEYDLGNGVKAYNIQVTDSGGKDTLSSKAKNCKEDGMSFTGFATLNSVAKDSRFEFTFTKKTTLILYIGSNGEDERGFVVYDDKGETIYEDVVNASEVGGKQTPKRVVLELDPGTYNVSALSTALTFHGYIIGTLKEAE